MSCRCFTRIPWHHRFLQILRTRWYSHPLLCRSSCSDGSIRGPILAQPYLLIPLAKGNGVGEGMLHGISCGRAHLIGGEEYKNEKPLQILSFSRSNTTLLLDPHSNNVTRRERGCREGWASRGHKMPCQFASMQKGAFEHEGDPKEG